MQALVSVLLVSTPLALRLTSSSNDPAVQLPLQGKRIAFLEVHFEGNVGDQLETFPVLRKLHEWGAAVDCYLSTWQEEKYRLNTLVDQKVRDYVDNIYMKFPEDEKGLDEVSGRRYDLAISSPGPNPFSGPCIKSQDGSRNVPLVYLGISAVSGWTEANHECLEMIAVREPASLDLLYTFQSKHVEPMLSADFSFSYLTAPYKRPSNVARLYPNISNAVSFMQKHGDDWLVLFSRFDNDVINIANGQVSGSYLPDEGGKREWTFPLENVLFASDDSISDTLYLEDLKKNHKLPESQIIMTRTPEELLCLVSFAPQVITDRYHPGVASKILGRNVSFVGFKKEGTKLIGLKRMMNYTPQQMREMNDQAFDELLHHMSK